MELRLSYFFVVLALLSPRAFAGRNPIETICNEGLSIGQHRVLGPELLDTAKFTEDGKKILSVMLAPSESMHDALMVTGVGPHAKNEILDPFASRNEPGVQIQISPHGNSALFLPPPGFKAEPVFFDVHDRSFTQLKEFAQAEEVVFSTDGKFVYARLSDFSLGVFNVEKHSFQSVAVLTSDWKIQTVGDSSVVVLIPPRGFSRWVDLKTLQVQLIKTNRTFADIQGTRDGLVLLLRGRKGRGGAETAMVFDSRDGTLHEIKMKSLQELELSPEGNRVLYVNTKKPEVLKVLDWASGAEAVLSREYGLGFSFSADGARLLYRKNGQGLGLIHLNSKAVSVFPVDSKAEVLEFSFIGQGSSLAQVQYKIDDRLYLALWNIDNGQLRTDEIPFDAQPQFSEDGKRALFYFPNLSAFKGGTYTLYDLSELPALMNAGKIVKVTSEGFFKGLAVPGAFKLAQHSQAVFEFFESGRFRQDKKLAEKILINVLSQSYGMYESLVGRYPEFSGEDFFFKEDRVLNVDPRWKHALEKYLDYFMITRANSRSIVESVKFIKAIRNYIGDLKNSKMNEYAGAVTEAMDDAAMAGEFHGVFQSMLYKFSEEYVYPLFWIPFHPMTDITFVRTPYELEPFILGSSPLSGKGVKRNPYGFYSRRLPPILIPKSATAGDVVLKDYQVTWTQDGKKFVATLDIEVVAKSIDPVTPRLKEFDFKQLWKDKKLTGMIIVGSNLAPEDASTLAAYKAYFADQGFEFEEHSTTTKDLKTYFQEAITGGELDYFIKEAHSDGDERNIVRINHRDKVMKAHRKMKNGFEEVVYLVFPTEKLVDYTDPTKTVQISNAEFGQWIRDRQAMGKGQFVYFNESCWSVSKAINEIGEAYSKILVEIPSTLPVNMFEDRPDNAAAILLTDFRAGKALRQIHIDMRRNPDFAHRIGNTFIFPWEKEYQDLIRDPLVPPVRVRVSITVDGKPFGRDE